MGEKGRKIIKCMHNDVVEVTASAVFCKSASIYFWEAIIRYVACVLCFGKGGAVKIVHNNIRGGKVVLLSQDGLKAILPVLIDRYGILHDQDDTEDQGSVEVLLKDKKLGKKRLIERGTEEGA
ncbi:hypothetical protein OPV22_034922 [Ensete ventricosum]|uniref:Uncharacterized protein n=1 Tax=Ensete ventricosum TaxID=4639 RepID=A0AAV8PQI2_ENSVE|nr:hypothetical protein OPV22_034922 [Ensete ventricosum]